MRAPASATAGQHVPQTAPATSRVTPESASRLVAVYAARWGLTGRSAPGVDWTFTVAVVAGLLHEGKPAWAVVDSQVNPVTDPDALPGGSAHVEIRDIDATPIPGFDGDPMLEIRVTVAHEMGHPVVAEALAMNAGAMNVPAEEHIVETAAQAIVRSEGTSDARVMARALRVFPSTLRARISASAGQRARSGGTMDPKIITEALDALIAGDAEKCAELLKGLIAAAAGATVAPADAPPNSDPAPPMGKTEATAPVQEAQPGAPPAAGGARVAARKDATVSDIETARARKTAETLAGDLQRMHSAALPTALEALITRTRARVALSPASEKRMLAAKSFEAAEQIAEILVESGAGPQRARSGVEHGTAEPTVGETKAIPAADLMKEGFDSGFAASYARLHARDPLAAAAELEGGREALASKRARLAKTGGAS